MILLSILDYIGSCAFCMSGAAMAYTLRMSLFGVFIMSLIAGYGGSCIRDTMLGNTPPILFQTPLYWYIAIFTVFFISLIKRQAAQVEKIVIITGKTYTKSYESYDLIYGIFTICDINIKS